MPGDSIDCVDTDGAGSAPVEWGRAPAAIRRMMERVARVADRAVIVAVCGPVASGKSSLARRLSACIVSTDDYLPDYDAVPYLERDEPRHADFARLAADLSSLRAGRPTTVPVWSFHTHRREGERRVEPAPIVLCEGIHAFDEAVAGLYDVRVFVDAPREARLRRWEARERSGVRGWGVETARRFFHEVAEPTFERYEARYRALAHVVVANDADESPA